MGRLVDGSVDRLIGLYSHLLLVILMICEHVLLRFFVIRGPKFDSFLRFLKVWGHLAAMVGSTVDF